jgi:DNA phosphorothioation-dependent restriction protein DptG
MDYVAMGKRIRAARTARNLTQTELAKRVGCSYPFLGHIERGTRIPSVETLCQIAKALNMSTDALLGLTNLNMEERARLLLERALEMAKEMEEGSSKA